METLRWLIPLLALIAIVVVGGRALLSLRSSRRAEQPLICTSCGAQTDTPRTKRRGSLVIEIVLWFAFVIFNPTVLRSIISPVVDIMLWLAFVFPGLLYSLWRQSTRQLVCPTCEKATLILANTPAGRKLAAQFSGGKS